MLFRVRNIVLIITIVYFPDWGEKRKLMFRSTKTVGFHGGEQGFSYRPVLPALFLVDLKQNSIFLFLLYLPVAGGTLGI